MIKKVSLIVLLSTVYPELLMGYTPTITDSNIRNHSYSVEQVSMDTYNALSDQQRFSYVNSTGNTEYYRLDMPDLSMYDSESYISTRQTPTGGNIEYNIHNSVATSGDNGGAIYGYADTITGNFVNNSVFSSSVPPASNVYGSESYAGGAIYVTDDINLISGNFVNNHIDVSDNFYKYGTAIYNSEYNITEISGTFIGNHGAEAIYNRGFIDNIEADFISNYFDGYSPVGVLGVALYNGGHIGNLKGDFVSNTDTGGGVHRAILANSGTIDSITGSFINNQTYGSTGVIENSSTGIINMNANGKDIIFSNPLASGAIYNSGTINMGGTNGQNIIFSTTHDGIANAGTINLNSGTVIFNGGIHSTGTVYNAQTHAYETLIGNINVSGADVYFDSNVSILDQILSINSGSVSIYANKIPNNTTNNAILKLTGGTLSQTVSGSGTLVIDGEVTSSVDLVGQTVINPNKNLTISADYIHSANLTNNGLLKLSGGTLSENISAYGNTQISGAVTTSANKLNTAVTNNGSLRITDGTIGQAITGTGGIVIDGNVSSDVSLVQDLTVNQNKTLTISASNLNSDYIYSRGRIYLTGGVLSHPINGYGFITISEDTISNVSLVNSSVTINAGKSLTIVADNLNTMPYINNGTLFLNGGYLRHDIRDGGDVRNIGTLETTANHLNADFINNGILNITSGTLTNNITGNGTVTLGNISLGSNNIQIQNSTTNINGTLQLNINQLAEDSSSYSGGKLYVMGNLNINPNSELQLVIAPSLLADHQATGELELIYVSGTRSGDFGQLSAKNMYNIQKSGNKYIISRGNSIKDIIQSVEDNENFINAGKAWNNAIFNTYSQQYNVQYLLSYLAQYDAQGYVEALDNVIPAEVNVADIGFRNINSNIIKQFSDRLSNLRIQGRSGGDTTTQKFNIWAQALFNKSEQTGKSKFDAYASGITFGAETIFDDKLMLAAGYTYGKNDVKSGAKKLDGTMSIFSLFAEYDVDAWYVNGGISYGKSSYKQTTKYENDAKFDADTLSLNAGVGYKFGKYTPEFRMIYTNTSVDKYKDAAGQEIQYDDNSVLSLSTSVKYKDSFNMKSAVITPEIGLGVIYDVLSDDGVARVDLGTAQYTIYGEKINPFGLNFGIGTGVDVGNWSFAVGYDLEWRNNFISHTGKVKAKYMF